ncbi:MAG: 2-nitropropane dioxygenase [Mycobacterium sp.]|nr:2-nitropropane dioxygenase [Mycobacterium sp.]
MCHGAGGHTGRLFPFAFLDEVREFFAGPLVVGGAISTGRGVRAVETSGPPCVVMYIVAGQAPSDATNCASIERSGDAGGQHGPRADCRSRRFGALA